MNDAKAVLIPAGAGRAEASAARPVGRVQRDRDRCGRRRPGHGQYQRARGEQQRRPAPPAKQAAPCHRGDKSAGEHRSSEWDLVVFAKAVPALVVDPYGLARLAVRDLPRPQPLARAVPALHSEGDPGHSSVAIGPVRSAALKSGKQSPPRCALPRRAGTSVPRPRCSWREQSGSVGVSSTAAVRGSGTEEPRRRASGFFQVGCYTNGPAALAWSRVRQRCGACSRPIT